MTVSALGNTRLDLQAQLDAAKAAGDQKSIAELEEQLTNLIGMEGTKDYRLSKYDKYLNFANGQKEEAAKPDFSWSVDRANNTITLDNGYRLTLDERRSQLTLDKVGSNGQIHRSTRIWGDPHIDVGNDGKTDADFYKDTSLLLEDGTKITIGTRSKGAKATYSDLLTITKGDQAVKVSGLMSGADALQIGDVNWDGKKIDADTNDGHLMFEHGNRWTLDDGRSVRQGGKFFKFAETETQNEVDWRAIGDVARPSKELDMGNELRWFLREENIRFADRDKDGRLNEAEWAKLIESIQLHQSMLQAEEATQLALLLDMIQDFDKTLSDTEAEDGVNTEIQINPTAGAVA